MAPGVIQPSFRFLVKTLRLWSTWQVLFKRNLHQWGAQSHKRNCWKLDRKPTRGTANHSLHWGSTLHTGWAEYFALWSHLQSYQTAAEPSIPVGKLRLKEGHIKIRTARVPNVRYTPDLVRLSTTCCYLLCLFVTEVKILNYSVVDTPKHSL